MSRWLFLLVVLVTPLALGSTCGDSQGSDPDASSTPAVSTAGSADSSSSSEITTTSPVIVTNSPVVSTSTSTTTSTTSTATATSSSTPSRPSSTSSLFSPIFSFFSQAFGSVFGDDKYDEGKDLDGDGVVGIRDIAMAERPLAGLDPDPSGSGAGAPPPPPAPGDPARPFSNSTDCKFCHPRQYNEWRTSPHAYTGISPTFYSLVAAGQNSFGAGVAIEQNNGVSIAGAVGNFCQPCHAPMGFIGAMGRYGGNNGGFANVRPILPFVCSLSPPSPINAGQPCTTETAVADCGASNACVQFEGRTCSNMPPVDKNTLFPRVVARCTQDSDCAPGGSAGCPSGGADCGPCIITPTTSYYGPLAQEGINCEACHNMLPNHQRSCDLFRKSDSAGVLSVDIAERSAEADGRRLRLGPYPIASATQEQGLPNDTLDPVANAFHESARVDTPLVVAYDQTDRRGGVANPQASPHILRPTAVTCEELPYCARGFCQGGPLAGNTCTTGPNGDGQCGGCQTNGLCGPGGVRAGMPCQNSVDCATPSSTTENLLQRGIDDPADETVSPLTRRDVGAGEIDRPDGNYYRSSMLCATCHDVRPPFVNGVLKSCQEQPSQVCATDADCVNLNIGCSGNDCGPCVAENADRASLPGTPQGAGPVAVGDPRNAGYRRVENLFSEWQLSVYNHPELTFCQGNSFRACTSDAQCMVGGFDEGPCNVSSPFGKVITCQDCHMSNFPETPLIDFSGGPPGVVVDKNDLYSQKIAALEGSQSDLNTPLPVRRVSTHFMAGVDLPLVKFPGQAEQMRRRQELIDSGFKITVDSTPSTTVAGGLLDVGVTVENVGVGHRFPAGFSHERQNWMQVYVQEVDKLGGLDPFDPNAPCNMQRTIATGAEDSRDPVGAAALAEAGCVYRSGFLLDKAHPETGEMTPDGSLDDEDPEDFLVVAGTRVRGDPGSPRIEDTPGAEGRALSIQYICAEATASTYRSAVAAGSGIDLREDGGFPYHVRTCDPTNTPGEVPGKSAPGFGNPSCMDGDADRGPCVPEIDLSDSNERGRCAGDLARASCQSDADCGPAGPCLFRCSGFPELECCDPADPACNTFYTDLGQQSCVLDPKVCVGGPNSGQACTVNGDCPISNNCGNVGPCNTEPKGITNFQNQFRSAANGVCVDPANPRDGAGAPIVPAGGPISCFLNLTCTLRGAPGQVCLINGECSAESATPGKACTNVTSAMDCPGGTCNVQANLELNGSPSESVFIQNHPFNFNSMPPFQPRTFRYEVEVPAELAGKQLVVAARLMNRHFPMRFLRNLIGTQVVRPPFIREAQGNPNDPKSDCNNPRSIDIDCFVKPVATLGNAEVGGYVPPVQQTRTATVDVLSAAP